MLGLSQQGRETGAAYYDLCRNQRGVLTGGAQFRGPLGRRSGNRRLLLGGSSQYLDCGSNLRLSPTAITVSAWVNGSAFTNAYNAIVSRAQSGTQFYQYFVKSTGKIAVYVNGSVASSSYDGTGTYTLSTGTWYRVTFTYDSVAGLKGYVNGRLDGSAAANGALNLVTANTAIGADLFTPPRWWTGSIDDVAIWNRALSPGQVLAEYLASQSGYRNELNWMNPSAAQAQAAVTAGFRSLLGVGI